MIKRLTPSDQQPYMRPNDDSYVVPVVSNEDGSEILVKRRSLRTLRKHFTWAVTAFTLGSLLILFQSPVRNDFLAPGPLTSNHAQILNGLGADRCNACHAVGDQSFMQWAISSLQPGRNVQACQSELCMKCHQKTMDNQFATLPHHVRPELLNALSNVAVSTTTVQSQAENNWDGNIECSTCHKEHHGNRDLTFLTDQQCQTCHQKQFDSFEQGHPEFTNWPQVKRQSIAFDHVSHGFKHFVASNTDFNCQLCHVDDSYSNVKSLLPYEQSCAKCHDQDIQLRNEPGVQIVGLPMLDLDAITAQGLEIGTWPDNATGDFDGELPELMHMLLCSDKKFLEIALRRPGGLAFSDFDPDSAEDVQDAVSIVWAIKRLMYELAIGGADTLQEKYSQALGVSTDDSRLFWLTRGLDANVFAEAANRWFPGIANEIPQGEPNHGEISLSTSPNAQLRPADADLVAMIEKEPILKYVPSQPMQDQDELAVNPIRKLYEGSVEPSISSDSNSPGSQSDSPSRSAPQPTTQDVPPRQSFPSRTPQATPVQQSAPRAQTAETQLRPRVQINEAELLANNPLNGKSFNQSNFPTTSQAARNSEPTRSEVGRMGDTLSEGNWLEQQLVSDQAVGSSQPVESPVNQGPTNQNSMPSVTELAAPVQINEAELLADNPLQGQLFANSRTVVITDRPGHFGDEGEASNSPVSATPDIPESSIVAKEFAEQLENEKRQQAQQDQLAQQEQPVEGGFDLVDRYADGETFVGTLHGSGWFRNDDLLKISYRPKSHADDFLTTMMELVSQVPNTVENPASRGYFEKMTSQSSVGACNDCHTVDADVSAYRVNWKPSYRDPSIGAFTHFSHGPHLIQKELVDCTACHQLNPELTNADSFTNFDASVAISNFEPIQKTNCVSCHHETGAGNSCTQCHNYHVGAKLLLGE